MTTSNAPADPETAGHAATPLRFNDSFVALHERKVLQAIVRRLPGSATPDRLTMVGVVGAMVVIAGYALSNRNIVWLWLANLGLVIHWFGDSLDGTIARFREIERPRYGFYLDQVIDTLGNTLIALGVGLSPSVRMDFVLIVLAVYHMLSIQVYVRAIVDREFHLAVGRFGPTEMRLGIIGMNVGLIVLGAPPLLAWPLPMTWCDVLLAGLSIGLLSLFAWQMAQHLRRLGQEDPKTV